jgi:hypothetical protein
VTRVGKSKRVTTKYTTEPWVYTRYMQQVRWKEIGILPQKLKAEKIQI